MGQRSKIRSSKEATRESSMIHKWSQKDVLGATTTTTTTRQTPSPRRRRKASSSASSSSSSSLLIALLENQEWRQAMERIQTHPEEVHKNDRDGFSSLSVACQYQAPVDVIDAILSTQQTTTTTTPTTHSQNHHPNETTSATNLCSRKNPDGSLPLHIACQAGASMEVIGRLLVAYPSACRKKDSQEEEQLPLHLAAQAGASEDVLMTLLLAYPKASNIRNRHGQTPHDLLSTYSMTARRALQQKAPILHAVYQASQRKLLADSDEKIRQVFESYQNRMKETTAKFEQEKEQMFATEHELCNELEEKKEIIQNLESEIAQLEQSIRNQDRSFQEQQEILEHIQGLISGNQIRQEEDGPRNKSPRTRRLSEMDGGISTKPISRQHPSKSWSSAVSPSSTPLQTKSVAKSPKSVTTRMGQDGAFSDARWTEHRQDIRQFESQLRARRPSQTMDHRPAMRWLETSDSDVGSSSEDTARYSIDKDEQERDPPPVPSQNFRSSSLEEEEEERRRRRRSNSAPRSMIRRGALPEPSPRSAALASVRDWATTTPYSTSPRHSKIGGGNTMDLLREEEVQETNEKVTSLLDHSKLSNSGRPTAALALRAAEKIKSRRLQQSQRQLHPQQQSQHQLHERRMSRPTPKITTELRESHEDMFVLKPTGLVHTPPPSTMGRRYFNFLDEDEEDTEGDPTILSEWE